MSLNISDWVFVGERERVGLGGQKTQRAREAVGGAKE